MHYLMRIDEHVSKIVEAFRPNIDTDIPQWFDKGIKENKIIVHDNGLIEIYNGDYVTEDSYLVYDSITDEFLVVNKDFLTSIPFKNAGKKTPVCSVRNVAIPEKDWIWYGNAGHLCVQNDCRYHLTTRVGRYLISSIGEYFPSNEEGMKEIGIGRYYETLVFDIIGDITENGKPPVFHDEIDYLAANTAQEAYQNHISLCHKWAAK
jgi:hypothetical protein